MAKFLESTYEKAIIYPEFDLVQSPVSTQELNQLQSPVSTQELNQLQLPLRTQEHNQIQSPVPTEQHGQLPLLIPTQKACTNKRLRRQWPEYLDDQIRKIIQEDPEVYRSQRRIPWGKKAYRINMDFDVDQRKIWSLMQRKI